MRILLVHNFYQLAGGEDAVFRNELTLLAEGGHEVDTLTVDNATIRSPLDRARSGFAVAWSRASYAAMVAKLTARRPDVVHVHNFLPLLTPAVFDACSDQGVPVVMTAHNYRVTCAAATLLRDGQVCELCIGRSPYWGAWHRCYRGSLVGSLATARMIDRSRRHGTWTRKVSRFIALTAFQRRKLIEAGLPAEKIVVKPNFLPLADEPELRPAERHGALYVGRLSVEKGVEVLLEAWRGIDYPLTIIGTGPLEPELRRAASPQVTFLGQRDRKDVAAAMRRAAFLVMPSAWYEGFPMTLVEAYAASLPAIGSRLGALAELIEEGATGRLFAAGDAADLRLVAEDHLGCRSTWVEMGKQARCRFESSYIPSINLEQLEAIYKAASH